MLIICIYLDDRNRINISVILTILVTGIIMIIVRRLDNNNNNDNHKTTHNHVDGGKDGC